MSKKSLLVMVSMFLLSGCGNSQTKEMQPLQPGQPPQKPTQSISTTPAIMGGQNGTTPVPFIQPFRLSDMEYQFIGVKGKDFVGLESNPSMRPTEGNVFFVVRYQVINRGNSTVTVPNNAAVHLLNIPTNLYIEIDPAATNANVQSGAATGMPDQLTIEPGQIQIQTLAYQVPNTLDASKMAIVVTDPKDPTHVLQVVQIVN